MPPFSLIGRCLAKVRKEKSTITLIAPIWQAQSCYSTLLQMLIQDHIKLPTFPEFLLSPQGKVHPLTENNNLTLGVWKIYLEVTQQQNYQKLLQTYTSKHGDQAHKLLIKVPGENGLAGVVNNHLILFRPLTNIVECLTKLFQDGLKYIIINTYRSAISKNHALIDSVQVGKHLFIIRHLRAIFNQRVPMSKYQFSWNVDTVLSEISSSGANDDLDIKSLS